MTPPSHILNDIARDVLEIETLDFRNSDRLDFHEVGVASLRMALTEAYHAGYKEAMNRVLDRLEGGA